MIGIVATDRGCDMPCKSVRSAANYLREHAVPEYCRDWRAEAARFHDKYAVAWQRIRNIPPEVLALVLKDVSEELKKHLHDELRLFISHHVGSELLKRYRENMMDGLLEPYQGHYVSPHTNYTAAFIETHGDKVALTEYPAAGIDYIDKFYLWDDYYTRRLSNHSSSESLN